MLLYSQKVRFNIIDVSGFDDIINIMLAFLANNSHFQVSFKYLSFLSKIRNDYAIFVICTKNEAICENGSINMLI